MAVYFIDMLRELVAGRLLHFTLSLTSGRLYRSVNKKSGLSRKLLAHQHIQEMSLRLTSFLWDDGE